MLWFLRHQARAKGSRWKSEETARQCWIGSTARQGKYRRGEQLKKFKDNCGSVGARRPTCEGGQRLGGLHLTGTQ